MRFSNILMSDPNTHNKGRLNNLSRTKRNSWAESIELNIRECCPYPITYDVTAVQPTAFTEYSYTEILGGMFLQTLSIDINTRLIQLASEEESNDYSSILKLKYILEDKYKLSEDIPDKYKNVKNIIILPGHNIIELASQDFVMRAMKEAEDVMIKPHPLTNDHFLGVIAGMVGGWEKIIPATLSGYYFLKNAENIYITTGSEMAISAIALDKTIHNISAYKHESTGSYYTISRILFNYPKDIALQKLVNIINCKWSGILFPWQKDYAERAKAFYSKSLELRSKYKPLHSTPHFISPKKRPEGFQHN